MTQRQYDAATATALMRLAYPAEDEASIPYIESNDGLYVNESFREECPQGAIYDWTPANEMDWPGSPNPSTAPFLPIPFTASDLAACMLDGPGQSIQFALERRIGYPLDDDVLSSISERDRWMREALQEAYALAAAAQLVAGEFDHDEEARAHRLAQQYDDANRHANDREGVFEQGITPGEARARRARAVTSVADLRAQARQVQAAVADKWKTWRKAMVKALLAPARPHAAPPMRIKAGNAERQQERQERRWQMCIDAGLTMPQDMYAQLPHGIHEIAKAEGISRQALAQDLNRHRERLFGK